MDVVKINRLIQNNLSTCFMHLQTFPKFKGIHMGKDICLVASGVSADKYHPVKDRIHIGVNRSFQIGNFISTKNYHFRTYHQIIYITFKFNNITWI